MARPLEFNPQEAVDRAMELFWSKGYDATSLSDLLAAMSLSRSSFYQSFGSKHRLYEQCLQHYRQSIGSQMLNELRKSSSARVFIEQLFNSIAEEVSQQKGRWGCMIMNSASAKAPFDPSVGKIVHAGAKQFEEIFYRAVKRGQTEGEISKDKDPQTLASYLVSSRSGLLAMARAGASIAELKRISEMILTVLE